MNIDINEIKEITKIKHDKNFKKDVKFINKYIIKNARKGLNCCTIDSSSLYCAPSYFIEYYNNLGFNVEAGFGYVHFSWRK